MGELVFDHLWKFFGDVIAVRDFNLTIKEGEFIVLVGPSGCGKTTTLRMVAGLEEISKGRLLMNGRVLNDIPPRERDIAMVFQNYALYPHMNVYENMAFGLKLRKVDKKEIKTRVFESAEILGIASLLDRKPKQLSGGQRQRVAMGRAMVRNPSVFLFDEPLSNLDAKLRLQMRTELSRLHKRLGKTSIYVTHDQIEAMTLADRMVIMSGGEIQQIGSPLEVYEKPLNLFVADFIGSPSMNFLKGVIEDGKLKLLDSGHILSTVSKLGIEETALKSRRVKIGIRPEHIIVKPSVDEAGERNLKGVIEVVEPLGAEVHFHIRIGREELVARAPLKELRPGMSCYVEFREEMIHLFDEDSGRSLRYKG